MTLPPSRQTARLPRLLRMFVCLSVVIWTGLVVCLAAAVEFQVPQQYATPAAYSMAGSTVRGERSNPAIGYWNGATIVWRDALDREPVQDKGFLGTGKYGYAMRWLSNIDQRYARIDDSEPLDIRTRAGSPGTPQGAMRGYGTLIRLSVPLSQNEKQVLGLRFSGPPQDKGSGSWRQQFNAQSTLRISKPGARAAEKMRVRVVGEIAGQSSGKDLQHSALEARIVIDQVADLRISGPNPNPTPRATIDPYVDVPVNTDLRWQMSFSIYASGQRGTTDLAVALTKQEITLELPAASDSFTSAPPPVKPLTGASVPVPNQTGAVVIPGSPSGTTMTGPPPGSTLSTPQPGNGGQPLGTQRNLDGPGSGAASSPPPGAFVIPRGVEAADESAEQPK
ncbi:protein of unknown function [Nitrospira japonica]|uniref:Uncharacterized protein n=1 Tax=Nitrospira japonica TaxID=1325564 RepID=A0A1W1I826_9BACT|nr:hypothetical protein [Nitrospira japonica]SLM49198.1 protein of unknown function [Nitrospira japonica]